ncbi:uncharacterized protein LOC100888173 isoform X5 [Strongylocentrotus purpuratus]|uniref:Uncharacterized protein n=1 Tax=Strongylocentrotus purpuratus TaxID=7668 RepID=A0A7M7T379_STRPU|nr:uncharacterized protein LOC100888173 isoform X5 [Strongylocentrotus purpuratus]
MISSPGFILPCPLPLLQHVNSFSAVLNGLAVFLWTVLIRTDMAPNSLLGAFHPHELDSAHLNIHHKRSAHQSSDSLLSTTTGSDVCISTLATDIEQLTVTSSSATFLSSLLACELLHHHHHERRRRVLRGSAATSMKLRFRHQASAPSSHNMAMKYACWTSISSTDGREGTLQSSQEHDEGNIRIKEEGEIKKETCLSIPGSDRLIYEGQLVTHDGLVFTIKPEVDTDMFESLSSTEGQDLSTEQEMVYATIKQVNKEEIFEPITTHGEGGGETEQSIPEGLVFTIKQEVDTDMFESLSSAEGQDPSTEQEMVNATIKQEDKEEIFEPITTQGEGAGENEQSILEVGQWTRQYTPT